jgi:hypothetical protein
MKAQENFMSLDTLLVHIDQLHNSAENEDLLAIKTVLHACVQGFHEQPS